MSTEKRLPESVPATMKALQSSTPLNLERVELLTTLDTLGLRSST